MKKYPAFPILPFFYILYQLIVSRIDGLSSAQLVDTIENNMKNG
jgi:hypothetical protein